MTKKNNNTTALNEAVKSWSTHRNPIIFTEIMEKKYFEQPQTKKITPLKNSKTKSKPQRSNLFR